MEGEWLGQLLGLKDVKTAVVWLGTQGGGQANLELVKYYTPPDEKGIQPASANTLGIRHLAFAVDDLESVVARLKTKGTEIFSEIQQYQDVYKLCYVRGPEGIILELAEELNKD